jgi:hypothetical protein
MIIDTKIHPMQALKNLKNHDISGEEAFVHAYNQIFGTK